MAYCSHCKKEIRCPEHEGFGHESLDQTVFPCEKECAIWVRAVDESGVPVPGITAQYGGKSDTTKQTGFAKLEKLQPGKDNLQVALGEAAQTDYLPLSPATLKQSLSNGDLKLVTVIVKSKYRPLMTVAPRLIAVKGKVTATVTLGTDRPYDGKGTFTCTQGADKIKCTPALTGNKLEIASFNNDTITVEAVDASDFEGVLFEWALDPAMQRGPAATDKMTVMQAKIKIFSKSGAPITSDIVVHKQNVAGNRRRARATLEWTPMGVEGFLKLTNADGKLAVYIGRTGGSPATMFAMEKDKSDAAVFIQGNTESGAKDDSELVLGIDKLCDNSDSVKLTVVDTKLEVCVRRTSDSADPTPVDNALKSKPGRELYLQGTTQRGSTRALLRVRKTPVDAPCDVLLKAADDSVTLWDSEVPQAETTSKKAKEVKITTPKTLVNADFDPAKGYVAWAEGSKLTVTGARSVYSIEVPKVEDETDRVAFTVVKTKIEITIERKDKQALSKPVKVGIKEKTAGPVSSTQDYSAKIAFDVTPGTYLFELAPQDQEKDFKIVRTEPAGSLEAAIVAKEVPVTAVKYVLEPAPVYKYIQFIGYQIETGSYMGLDNLADDEGQARSDFTGRCDIMKGAVDLALPKTNALSDTLKVFVAPEFYFRGVQGAYSITLLSEIAENLRAHVSDAKFKDWIFVFGSAIGLLKQTDDVVLPDVTNVTIGSPPPLSAWIACDVTPLPAHTINKWAGGSSPLVPFPAITVTKSVGNIHEVKFATPRPMVGPTETLWLHDGITCHPIPSSSIKSTVKCLRGKFTGSSIPDSTLLKQGANYGYVVKAAVNTGAQTCELFVDFAAAVAGADLKLTQLGKSEIFNVVFVQKGGGGGAVMNKDGSRSLNELLIYKEVISPADFSGIDYGELAFYDANRHSANLRGQLTRLLPTQGAKDSLGENPNEMGQKRKDTKGVATTVDVSEKTTSGLGGGCLFTMDGVQFGVDVCVDHLYERVKKGGVRVHIHLIPSCGMSIDDANVFVVPKGFVFNVDGQGGAAHTVLKKEAAGIGQPAGLPWGGPSRATFFGADGTVFVYPRQLKEW